ncbi:phage tail sheath subtilisin-like domain-containing protein [uncultured Desulfovibrio sp.]|uniref:phage tail sheath subtilisin-like domain-containing protein n=1 Tax=uncultured Desulfovibrio sp. TaxID=167968 RepID=UPI00039D9E6E|nr:phage tail sheath subtilisin-like domain-containing protein [uncultured Desulfovibrio sp.]
MAVSFNSIPADIRVPLTYVEFDNSGAVPGTPVMEWRVLLLGQAQADAAGDMLRPMLMNTAEQAARLWGQGSQIADMVRYAKRNSTMLEIWAMAVPDAESAVAAQADITISGQCTGTGVLALYIGGVRVRVQAVGGEALGATVARVVETINADGELPVTASVKGDSPGVFTLTCKWKGATGNAITLGVNLSTDDNTPAGLRVACGPMQNGAADPDMQDVIAAMGDTWWKALVTPWNQKAERELLEEWLDAQFGPLRQQECQAFTAFRGTLAETSTYGNGGNSQLVSCMGIGDIPTSPWNVAAAYAMQAAASLSADPARPLQTLELVGVMAPAREKRWSMEERNILLYDGIATYMVASDDSVQIEREVTMYQKNAWGSADPSYLDVQTVATLGYWRYAVNARITQKYPRHKLADDGTAYGPGNAVVTPSVIRAELLALMREFEEKGLVENVEAFKEGLVVERNRDDRNRIDVLAMPDLVNQFRIFACLTRFVL